MLLGGGGQAWVVPVVPLMTLCTQHKSPASGRHSHMGADFLPHRAPASLETSCQQNQVEPQVPPASLLSLRDPKTWG